MESLRGSLLIPGGGLYDPNFRHTVVLIGEHGADGALGVILNRPLDMTVADTIPALEDYVGPGEVLYEGGPVQPTGPVLVAELDDPGLADLHVFGHVGFLVGDLDDDILPHIRRARAFVGYSGWAAGQLEAEMIEDSWIVDPARADDVFTEYPDLLWSQVLQRKGPEYHRMSRMPYDPTMN